MSAWSIKSEVVMRLRALVAASVVVVSLSAPKLLAQSTPGAYDLTWGGSARTRVNFNDHVLTNASAYDTVIQAPNTPADANFRKIVVFGSSDEGTRPHFAAVRLNINGTRDMGWGANNAISGSGSYGVVKEVDLGTWDTITNGVRTSDNRLLMLGWINLPPQPPPSNATEDWRVVKYTVNGDRDTSFGYPNKDGVVILGMKGNSAGAARTNGLTVDAAGNVYCAGYTNTSNGDATIEIVKLTSTGTPDATFGTNGRVSLNPAPQGTSPSAADQAWGVGIQTIGANAGKVVVVGRSLNKPMVLRLNTNGTLDTSFGTNGYTFINAFSGVDYFRGMTIDAQDRIIGVGKYSTTCSTGVSSGSANIAMIARFTPNGALDTANFNSPNGYNTQAGIAPQTIFQRVQVAADGKYVASGAINPICLDNTTMIGAYRYNTNGTLDTTFGRWVSAPCNTNINDPNCNQAQGHTGMAMADVVPGGNSELARGVAIQPDGSILVSGEGYISNLAHMFVARFKGTDGQLDTNFNKNGQVVTSQINIPGVFATRLTGSSADFSYGTMVQADGKVVQVGTTWNGWDYDFGISRMTTEGILDLTFGDDDPDYQDASRHTGRRVIDLSTVQKIPNQANNPDKTDTAYAVAKQSDGKIIVAGTSAPQAGSAVPKLFRLNTDGSLDTSFGSSGYVTGTSGYRPRAMVVDASNNIYVTGDTATAGTIFVIKYNSSGGSPVERTSNEGAFGESHAITLQPDGKIVIAGRATFVNGNPFKMLVGRLNNDATLTIDSTFASGRQLNGADDPAYTGIFQLAHQDGNFNNLTTGDAAEGVAVEIDGKIVLGGRTVPTAANSRPRYALGRVTPAGRMDLTFGSNGFIGTDLDPSNINAHDSDIFALQVQNDGQMVGLGTAGLINNYDFAAARYNFDDGSLDTLFNTTGVSTIPIGQGHDIATSGVLMTNGQAVLGGFDTLREDFVAVRWQGDNAPTGVYSAAPALTAASDSYRPGYVPGPTDKVTNVNAPTLTGSPCVAGETVILRVFNQTSNVEQTWHPRYRCRPASNNIYTATVPAYPASNGVTLGALPDGTYKIKAYAATGNGNTGESQFVTDIIIDTFAAVPTTTSPDPLANPAPSRDVEQQMTFSGGGAENNALVTVYDTTTVTTDATTGNILTGAVSLCSTFAAANGTWSCTINANTYGVATLGLRKVQPRQVDIANNASKFCKAGVGTCGTIAQTGEASFFAKAQTTTSVVTSINPAGPARYFQAFTLTAQIRSNVGTPDDTVGNVASLLSLLYDGNAVTIPTGSHLDVNANYAYSPSMPQTVADHYLRAIYAGSNKYFASNNGSPGFLQQVIRADTQVGVVSTANPSVYGQSLTVTGTPSAVAPGGGTPPGTLQRTVDLVATPPNQNTYTSNSLSVGTHPIMFEYLQDTNYNYSTTTLQQVVNKASTTATVTASPNPAVYGPSGLLTVKVQVTLPGTAVVAPTGNVDVLIDGVSIGTVAPSSIGSTIAYPTLSASATPHVVTVSYPGDGNFNSSTGSLAGGLTINKAATSISVSRTPTTSVTGETVTYSATVNVTAPGTGTPGGTVTYNDAAGGTCTITLAAGTGTCTIGHPSVGTKTVTATYNGDTNFNTSTNANISQVVTKASTTTSFVSKDQTSSVVGQPVDVVFNVAVTAPGGGTPGGLVTVSAGADSCTAAPGVGHCAITFTSIGSKSILITYAGDTNYNSSAAGAVAHDVAKAATSVTINDTPDPTIIGQAVTIQYTVPVTAPGAGTPTGNVTVSDGTTSCTGTVAAGQCTITYNTVGQRTLTASYPGDANFEASASPSATHDVTLGPSSIVINSRTPAASVTGQSVVVAFTVSAVAPASGTPTGTVTVTSGTDTCNTTLSGGTGSCTIVLTSAGNRTLTATYSGDVNFMGASNTATQVVSAAATTTTINSHDANPSVTGEGVAVAATVAVTAPGTGTPTGSVLVSSGSDNCTITLSGGTGQCTLTFTSTGAKTITAAYQTDGNFAVSSNTASHTVNKPLTTTTLGSAPAPSRFGESVTLTATLAVVAPGTGTIAGGTVAFSDNGNAIAGCTAVTVTSNTVTCITNALTTGAHTNITAAYSGSANFEGSTSSAFSHTVNMADTSGVVTSSVNPSIGGQSVTFTATFAVSGAGAGTPAGNVDFLDGVNPICTAKTLTLGAATCTTTALSIGSHSITAVYAGDANFNGSTSSALTQNVTKTLTTTAVGTSKTPTVFGESVTFTATVTVVPPGAGTPTGTVAFNDGANAIAGCTSQAVAAGIATCTTTALSVSSHTINAMYSGDNDFEGSTGSATQNVSPASTSTVVVTSNASTTYGESITFTATLSVTAPGAGTPTGTVTFLTTDLPICSNVTLTGNTAQCITTTLFAGSHTAITARYSGDSSFATSTSGPITQTVAKASTTTTIGASAASQFFGSPVTLTATIAVTAPGAGSAGGTVDFLDNGTPIGSCNPAAVAANAATCTVSTLSIGNHTNLTATYSGNINFSGSSSGAAAVLVIGPADAAQSTAVASPASIAADGAATSTITVHLRDVNGVNVPTKSVTLSQGAAQSTIAPPNGVSDANGIVTFTVSSTKAETATYTATDTTDNVAIGQQPQVTFTPGAAASFSLVAASGTQVAGTTNNATITARDAFGNVATSYTGAHSLTFSGAGATSATPTASGSAFGTPASISFANGVGTAALVLVKVETANVHVTDGTVSDSAAAAIAVTPAAFAKVKLTLTTPQQANSPFSGTNTVTAQDAFDNTVPAFTVAGDTLTFTANAPLAGTISGLGSGSNNVLDTPGSCVQGVCTLAGMTYTGSLGIGSITVTSQSGKSGTAPMEIKFATWDSMSPTSICAGTGPVLITLTGTEFTAGMTLTWNAQSHATTFVNNTTLTVQIPAADVANAQNLALSLSNQTGSFVGTKSLTVLPIPVATAASDGPACSGGNVQLTAGDAGLNATYSWTGPGGFQSLSRTPLLQGVTAASAGVYTVTVMTGGCPATASTTVVVGTPPDATINAPLTVAASSVGNAASVTPANGATYTWSLTGGTITSGAGTPSITWNAGGVGTTVINVSIQTTNCTSSSSRNVTVFDGSCAAFTGGPTLTAPADGAGSVSNPVTFTWSPVSGADSYSVSVGNGGSVTTHDTTATSLTLSLPSGNYSWLVSASRNGCSEQPNSATRTFTIPAAPNCPSTAPSLLSPAGGSSTSSGMVTFMWSSVAGASGYEVFASQSGGPAISFGQLGANTTSYTHTFASSGVVSWSVQALFAGCPPVRSITSNFNITLPDPCGSRGTASIQSPASNAPTTSPVTLVWNDVPGAAGYRVRLYNGDSVAPVPTTSRTMEVTVPPGTTWWSVEALFDGCPSTFSAAASFTVTQSGDCSFTSAPALSLPAAAASGVAGMVDFSWQPVSGAVGYELWAARNNGTPTRLSSTYSGNTASINLTDGDYRWWVRANFASCPPRDAEPRNLSLSISSDATPSAVAPLDDITVAGTQVGFDWLPSQNAKSYSVVVNGQTMGTVVSAPAILTLAPGEYAWQVRANYDAGSSVIASPLRHFRVSAPAAGCRSPQAPAITSASSVLTSGGSMILRWQTQERTSFELQQSRSGRFDDTVSYVTPSTSVDLPLAAPQQPGLYYYRVVAVSACSNQRSDPSEIVTMDVRAPIATANAVAVSATDGALTQTFDFNANAILGSNATFTVTSNAAWLTFQRSSDRVTGTINVPALGAGRHDTDVVVQVSGEAASRTVHVTVNVIPPSTSRGAVTTPGDSLVLLGVAHARGQGVQWRSDVRIANTGATSRHYTLVFTPTGTAGARQTRSVSFDVDAGVTVAVDDVLATWFGYAADSSVSGMLDVIPAGGDRTGTVVSSRTYSLTGNGTAGQFIPAIARSSFAAPGGVLSLQQVSESDDYRTNVGIVETSGERADVDVDIFDTTGAKVKHAIVQLPGGTHMQITSLLAQQGVRLDDARVELRVTSKNGRIAGYASVVDNHTNDPFLVPAVDPSAVSASRYVLQGIADVSTWRSDVYVYNPTASAISAAMTYRPQGTPADAKTLTIDVAPGQTRAFRDVLRTAYGISNSTGAIEIDLASAKTLVVTARTYSKTSAGTYGQFIPAATAADARGRFDRSLALVQLEDTAATRTNLGITEMAGAAARVEITLYFDDGTTGQKVIDLAAHEFQQINSVVRLFRPNGAMNVRAAVRVLSGDGRVAAYASVIDNVTQDPFFVPAQ
jgi:uncharacterized delta-60 repeat protein